MGAAAAPYAFGLDTLAHTLDTDLERGLTSAEAAARLALHGPNRLRRRRRPPYARLVLNQLLDPLVGLLIAATAVSVAIGDTAESAAIAAVLILNGSLGFWQELAAERAVLALSREFTQSAIVVREGIENEVPAEEIVPGDLLVLREGDRVAADARVIESRALATDESALTGESLPAEKEVEAVGASTPLAERRSMVYAGTGITHGHGRAVVCATGAATELGQIEALAAAARPPATLLERRLARLTRQMVAAGVLLTIALAAAMLLHGEPLHSAFLTGVAVAVAAVPEGLAATITAALALGARALARRGAIVRRLEAIETLGETTVICTDKTGTLTENQIRVAAMRPASGVDEHRLLEAAVLASATRASDEGHVFGDPIEAALLLAAMERGLSQAELLAERTAVHEIPFDSDRKLMTIVYAEPGVHRVFTKGAPEVVAARSGAPELDLLELADAWASEGFRVLAVASRSLDDGAEALDDTVEAGLELLGVIALHDPLKPTAAEAVGDARRAGIAVRMLTGDHPTTARTIGHALGLAEAEVVARATPASKLALVGELQARGEVVAVTGDGVNDAPALRRADVGVAMGRSGTEAAREAAAIILTDDDFATIIAAVREGRRIGDNIRKFVAFLLSANLGEVLVFGIAVVGGLGAPLAVIQVLVVNLVTDGLPALALARDPASAETMAPRPRAEARLFDRRLWLALALIGVLVGAATFVAFVAGKAFGGGGAQTMAYATLALSELALVFGMRSTSVAAWRLPVNRWLIASALGAAVLVGASVYLPAAHEPLATVSLSLSEALVVLALAALPAVLVEISKAVRRREAQREPPSSRPVARPTFRRSSNRRAVDERR